MFTKLSSLWNKQPKHGHARILRPGRKAKLHPRLLVEPLEDRLTPSTINWVDRDNDTFEQVFGAVDADKARQVIDAALLAWQNVITSGEVFNVEIEMLPNHPEFGAAAFIEGTSN